MTSPDNTATSWRDLADQLTTEQRERLEQMERAYTPASADAVAWMLLDHARDHARDNLVDAMRFGHVARPAGATYVWHWEQDEHGQWFRQFEGTGRKIGGFSVSIDGRQYPDGSVFRTIAVQGDDREEFDLAGARQFAAELIAAADEIEGSR
ncbi:hypothetical protein BVU76_21715 [Mycolicibacterium porcinum]|nr:hypothetical protein BVU76_21715 [Mycolicibacterium porcinum]